MREMTEEEKKRFEEMRARMEEAMKAREPYLNQMEACSRVDGDFELPYRLYVPQIEAGKKYPIVIFLHGIGECGTDNRRHVVGNDGAPAWLKPLPGTDEPYFVMAPQLPAPQENGVDPEVEPNIRWTDAALKGILNALADVEAKYPIDADRRYLTGLSLGGYGSWMLNTMAPDLFAAVVTCCPACLFLGKGRVYDKGIADSVPALMNKAVWMFHAEDDPVVPVEVSRKMKAALEAAGKTDFHFTEYPADRHYQHACWDAAYADAEMRQWLFAQRKK